jgi:tetratricopeptide (TPR) repeat protein
VHHRLKVISSGPGRRRRWRAAVALLAALAPATACTSTREFWRYVVEDDTEKPLEKREKGEVDAPRLLSPYNVKVVYNDGSTSTEVLIPVLSSGQQIIIDHKSTASPQSLSVVPLPPSDADKTVEDAYVKSGGPVSQKGAPVSIVKTQERIRELVKDGNYGLALEFAEQVLKRYPNHVKTLRTKGSLLLKLGEREAALKTYQKAQEIEPDPRVEDQIKAIENQTGGQ